jgi:transposase
MGNARRWSGWRGRSLRRIRQVVQARALLLAGDGVANAVIAEEVAVTAVTVRAWRMRFGEAGLAGLEKIREGRGRKPSISEEAIAEIVRLTTTTTPPGATHWSCRTMAKRVGVSPATVQRIWSDLGLQPHRVGTFKVSTDPKFEDKLVDVVGLYLDPPERRSCCAWTRSRRSRPSTAPRHRCR